MVPEMPVVLVHWNAPDRLLSAVSRLTASIGVAVKTIVVDSNSDPEAVDELEQKLPPDATLLRLADNRGYAGGVNAAMDAAVVGSEPVFAVAAHDVLVTPDTLRILRSKMLEHPDFGVLGPVFWDPDFTQQESAGGRFAGTAGGPLVPAREVEGLGERDVVDVDFASGAILVIRKACFDQVGGFDDGLFAYWEDVDFCLSARRHGWRVGVVPAAAAAECGYSARLRTHAYLIARNHILVMRKHAGTAMVWATVARVLARAARAFGGSVIPLRTRDRRRRSRDFAMGRLLGALDGVRGRSGPPRAEVVR